MPDPEEPGGDVPDDRLASLDRRVKDALDKREALRRVDAARAEGMRARHGASAAWRIVINLIIATALFGGIGLGLDRLLGSTPWIMCVGLFAGFALGMYLAARAANAMSAGDKPADR